MNVLITGSGGQLGWALQKTLPAGIDAAFCNRPGADITDKEQLQRIIARHQPAVVINAAAYTAVDLAETEKEKAFAINARGPRNLAELASEKNFHLIHVSTDFVFNGLSSTPYAPADTADPLSVYGQSKLEGERAVLEVAPGNSTVVRTSWVYSAAGKNFVKTILRLLQTQKQIRVVDDQIGSPTHARSLARFIWNCASEKPLGLWHWTDSGQTSWHGFAAAIQREALKAGLVEKEIPVLPIPTSEYPTPARRPAYSVLDTGLTRSARGVFSKPWEEELRDCIAELKGGI